MFAQKIQGIEAQIQQLQEQQAKYKNLHTETLNALALITQIQQQAADLGELEAVAIAFLEALQIQSAPKQELPEQMENYEEATETTPIETTVTLIEDGVEGNEETVENNLERYLDPEQLQYALNYDDAELIPMEIASLLDCSHEDDLEERVRYFIEKLPSEMCDRLLAYLPKNIALLWVEAREKLELEARESLFPPAAQIAVGDRVEVKKKW